MEKASVQLHGLEKVWKMVSLHGSIGSGKTFLVKAMMRLMERERCDATNVTHLTDPDSQERVYLLPVLEPVDEWDEPRYDHTLYDENGQIKSVTKISPLRCYYNDPAKMALPFQIMTFTTRYRAYRTALDSLPVEAEGKRIVIFSDGDLLRDQLFMHVICETYPNELEMARDVYNVFFPLFCDSIIERVDTMVYLPVSVSKCEERQRRRDRLSETEQGIPVSYLESLDLAHKRMTRNFVSQPGKRLIKMDCWEIELSETHTDTLAGQLWIELINGTTTGVVPLGDYHLDESQ